MWKNSLESRGLKGPKKLWTQGLQLNPDYETWFQIGPKSSFLPPSPKFLNFAIIVISQGKFQNPKPYLANHLYCWYQTHKRSKSTSLCYWDLVRNVSQSNFLLGKLREPRNGAPCVARGGVNTSGNSNENIRKCKMRPYCEEIYHKTICDIEDITVNLFWFKYLFLPWPTNQVSFFECLCQLRSRLEWGGGQHSLVRWKKRSATGF